MEVESLTSPFDPNGHNVAVSKMGNIFEKVFTTSEQNIQKFVTPLVYRNQIRDLQDIVS